MSWNPASRRSVRNSWQLHDACLRQDLTAQHAPGGPGHKRCGSRIMACVICARSVAALLLLHASSLMGQRVFEKDQSVIYEDDRKNRINFGRGFSPVLTEEGKIALIRGPRI